MADMTFIDLFAGIGGMRAAFEDAGFRCVFSSEWDKYARKTYAAFFGENECGIAGDIKQVDVFGIPNHDVLVGGFPCQPFSIAGVSCRKSLGRPHGFEDPTQGTLFFNLKEILKAKRPKAFLLENVKNLVSHDKGRTFSVIKDALVEDLGYSVFHKVIDASAWLPQHRERIYIVGFREKTDAFEFPSAPLKRLCELDDLLQTSFESKYVLKDRTWEGLKKHKQKHQEKGNGFGYNLILPPFRGKRTHTLSARYYKDGSEILISAGDGGNPRRLTPLECLRLQGFPKRCERFFDGADTQPISDTQAYKQFGNSVAVPVVAAIAKRMAEMLANWMPSV